MGNKKNNFERMGGLDGLLRRLHDLCLIDLQLAKSTTYNHVSNIRQFLEEVNKPVERLTAEDVRSYLLLFMDKNPILMC